MTVSEMSPEDRLRWEAAHNVAGLAYVMIQWLMQTGVQSRPGRVPGTGPLADSSAPDMLPAVTEACQARFLVSQYLPAGGGYDSQGRVWRTLACVHGFATWPLVSTLSKAAEQAGLEVRVWHGVRLGLLLTSSPGLVVRTLDGKPDKRLGVHLSRRQLRTEFNGCAQPAIEALCAAYQITIVDRQGSSLWQVLSHWARAHK